MTGELEPWICCQLGAREHYAVPRALHRRGALDLLLTDAWVRSANPLGLLKPGLRARFHPELATARVWGPTLRNIAFELRARRAGLHDWPLVMARNDWFQRAAVARLSRIGRDSEPRTLMAYSYAAREIIRFARSRGWRTVLGQIDPGPVEERIVAKLHAEAPGLAPDWRPAPDSYWSAWREECALADRIVVNSAWSRNALLQEGMPADKIAVIPLAHEEDGAARGFHREYPASFDQSRPLRLLFLGQVNLRKGMGTLLEAVRLLRGRPIEFTFAGPIQLEVPADLRDERNVRWVGSVPRGQASRFYQQADVFVLPTISDGFALTQLEAQAWKLPVIATARCGEVIEDGKNGWILAEITADEIATTLLRCLEAPSRLQQLSDASGVTERFSMSRVADQWLGVFA
jgi:glycosyltransferase involved in cell wall biosynthesis